MKRRTFFITALFSLLMFGGWAWVARPLRAQEGIVAAPQVNGTILRTLAYHQLTVGGAYVGLENTNPLVSDDGSRVLFAHYTFDPRYTHVMVANFDGTQAREVNRIDGLRGDLLVDMSADGAKVVTTDEGQLWLSNGDGSGTQKLIQFEYGRIHGLKISGDGRKVFFRMFESSRTVTGPGTFGPEVPRGIYVMDANGANLRRIVGPAEVAPLLGVPVDQVPWFTSSYYISALDVSYDGARLAFVMHDRPESGGVGQRLFSVNLDGSGLVTAIPRQAILGCFMSGDGRKIAYFTEPFGGPREAGVVNADGSGRKALLTQNANGTWPFPEGVPAPDFPQFFPLNFDGSKVLLGISGVLADTLSGAMLQIGIQCGTPGNAVVGDGLWRAMMSAGGNRFAYVMRDPENRLQIATAEINPAALGEAPAVSEPKVEPGFVITNGRSSVTLSARVNTNNNLFSVGGRFLRNGLMDVYVCVSDRYAAILKDDGTQGDTTAGDRIFTDNRIQAFAETAAIPGPRTIRVKAEATTGDGKRHAGAIDFEPFVVTNQTPILEVVPTALEFGDVAVNQTKDLPVTLRNTGTIQLTINALTIDNARFTSVSPSAPFTLNADATQTVTVRFAPTATGQQRGTLTITSSDPARPTVTVALAGNGVSTGGVTILDHTMTGGPVPGACVKPTVKTTFAPTDTEAIQWTLASGMTPGDAIRWEWVQPNGAVYRTFNHTLQQANQGQACFWDGMPIASQPAASLPGNWQVRVFIKGVQMLTENFTISGGGGACPVITNVSPSSGAVGTSVTISGTGFNVVNGVKFSSNVSATFSVVSDTQITATVPSGAVTGSIVVSEPNCNDAQAPAPFTVTQAGGRNVRIVCATASLGGTLTVTVELDSLGDENAVGFSLNFDAAVLSNPQAVRGSDTTSGTLNFNTNQAAQGRVGLGVALPFGQTFAAGKRQLAVLTFTVSATTAATSTTISFGDAPAVRRVSDANAMALPANYISQSCGAVPILRGYEADVMPRPNGKNDGTISINDWVMIGRFSVGLDTPAAGSEFQRADCAPRTTKGDGLLAIDDWVQAGRYFAALDAVQTIGGPSAPAGMRNAEFGMRNSLGAKFHISPAACRTQQQARVLRIVNTTFVRGQLNALSIELLSQGDENAVGFSLQFDQNLLTYVSAEAGSGASNALLILNTSQTAAGRLGIALALSAGEKFAAGTRALVTVRFNAASTGTTASTAISFGDQPIRRQLADVNANSLTGTYTNGAISLANAVACVSAASFVAERMASESIVAAFGTGMATATASASSVPLPTTLAGTTVRVRDSAGVERLAPLFFVSAGQINYQLPQGTANGATTITISSGDGTVSTGTMQIARVAPGLFAANANGQGLAAALALRVKTDGSQIYELVSSYDTVQQRYVPLPVSLGPEGEQVYLILYGTGARNFSNLANVLAQVGGANTGVTYVGAVEGLVGLDQLNVGPLPRSLAGRGVVNIAVQVDGQAANVVTVSLR